MHGDLHHRLLVFSREWMRDGVGQLVEEEEDEEESRKKYKALCDGLWSILSALVPSPVSRCLPPPCPTL